MAIRQVGRQTTNEILELQGVATDTKPSLEDKNTGSNYLVVDTAEVFVWHIDQWYPI